MIPILQMRKLKGKEVKKFAWSFIARKWQGGNVSHGAMRTIREDCHTVWGMVSPLLRIETQLLFLAQINGWLLLLKISVGKMGCTKHTTASEVGAKASIELSLMLLIIFFLSWLPSLCQALAEHLTYVTLNIANSCARMKRLNVPCQVTNLVSRRARIGPVPLWLGNLIFLFCCLFSLLIEVGCFMFHSIWFTLLYGNRCHLRTHCRTNVSLLELSTESPHWRIAHSLLLQHFQSIQLLKYLHVWAKHINLSICLCLPFQESITIVTWYSDKRLYMRMEQRPDLLLLWRQRIRIIWMPTYGKCHGYKCFTISHQHLKGLAT